MGTFMLKTNNPSATYISNIFIDKYLPKASGDFVKVYILGLKFCQSGEMGVASEIIAQKLNILEDEVLSAWNYWADRGVINLLPLDSQGNFSIEFIDLSLSSTTPDNSISLLQELEASPIKGMFQEIEKLIGRPLSVKEMEMYLSWQKDFNFSSELIFLLIEYAISKGKTDYRYMEKIAISWHDSKIKTINDAQSFIKQHEDIWVNMKKILKHIGLSTSDIPKAQEVFLSKWLTVYKLPIELIYKACDICVERLNKPEFKYIDAILNDWFKSGVKTFEDIELKKKKRTQSKSSSQTTTSKGSFGDFEQRNYDFGDLEKKLLGWDSDD